MRSNFRFLILTVIALTGILFSPYRASADSITYITINTSAVNNTAGYIDLQFNGSAGSANDTATVTGFSTSGSLTANSANTAGNVTGTLPAAVAFAINGQSQQNDYNQRLIFGNSITFAVDLAGNPPPAGDSFFINLYAADFSPILTTDPAGQLGEIDANGSATPTATGTNGSPITFSSTANTPEPSSFLFVLGALLPVGLIAIRRRVRAHATGR